MTKCSLCKKNTESEFFIKIMSVIEHGRPVMDMYIDKCYGNVCAYCAKETTAFVNSLIKTTND